MRVLLVSLNAKYVHTNLAIRYLKEVLKQDKILEKECLHQHSKLEVDIGEFTINEQIDKIAAEIYEEKPDVIGFSCYIWNIAQTLAVIRRLRPVMPKVKIFLGGPEVSYDPEKLMKEQPAIDAVVIGEGELILPGLINVWLKEEEPTAVGGVVWRRSYPDTVVVNQSTSYFCDLNEIPNPYTEDEDFTGKLVYVETSRGCPFNCSFCISSTFKGVRFLEPEKFRIILKRLFQNNARTIKFVDRTFNSNKKHAFKILDIFKEEVKAFINKEPGVEKAPFFRAHCEMAGELLDDEWLNYLGDYPQGLIQLEIGVQSTHRPALELINRSQHFDGWKEKARQIQHQAKIPVHLDLIAGLPEEGWVEFAKSFNEVIEARPNHLQLGFLKVLKGSDMRELSGEHGLVYSPDAPYTILQTAKLSHQELLRLHRIEELVEKYYNSGKFRFTLEYVFAQRKDPFAFFAGFSDFWHRNGWFKRAWKSKSLYENLWLYLNSVIREKYVHHKQEQVREVWREALRFDYYLLERPGDVPQYLVEEQEQNAQGRKDLHSQREMIRRNSYWEKVIPEFNDMDKRQWNRATAVESFAFDIPGEIKDMRLMSSLSGQPTNVQTVFGQRKWFLFYYKGQQEYYRFPEQLLESH